MLKVNAIVIGIGAGGISAINRIAKANMPELRTAVLCPDDVVLCDAEYIFKSKHDFLDQCNKLFPTPDTAVFIVTDCADGLEISIACELAFITARMGGMSVALAHMPPPGGKSHTEACNALEELHECFDGVVRFNECYCDSFETEVTQLFGVLSRAMSSEAVSGLRDISHLKKIFERQEDMFFACVSSKEIYDSHPYRAKCLELKLCAQTYLDTAGFLNFFYSSAGPANHQIINTYINPIKKTNIAFMNTINTYITENSTELRDDELVFAVLCAK